MSEIDEIKNRLDVVDVIREYIQLKQAGANWKGLCPFHNEKTPSFMVSREKQIWHCFGCNEGGDIFSFIQKMEGIEFPEALKILADKAGVNLSYKNPKIANEKTKLMDVCENAARFFHAVLLESQTGQIARDYLKKREVTEDSIEDFRLGYAPDSWDSLMKALTKKGFSEKEIFLAGLTSKRDRGVGYYDRFRGRLMFPIADIHGNIVGFTARILGPQKEGVGKYINTPQTPIYDKSRIIYGLYKAKQEIKKEDLVVLVEGNMDVITSHGAGVKNVVASSGTALTVEQIKILKRYTENTALAFDADPAGEGAVERGIDLALGEGLNVKIIEVPGGKDPDECIKSSNGLEAWKKSIVEAESIMEYYFRKIKEKYDILKVEDKKRAGNILLGKILKISNKIEQTHWLQKLSDLLNVPEEVLRTSLLSIKQNKKTPLPDENNQKKPAKLSKEEALERELMAVITSFPEYFRLSVEKIMPDMLINPQFKELYKKMVYDYTKNKSLDLEKLEKSLSDEEIRELEKLRLFADKDFSDEAGEKVLSNLLNIFLDNFKRKKRKELEQKISEAEKAGDKDRTGELMEELLKLSE